MPWIEHDLNDEYFSSNALSQSMIKALITGMGTYKSLDPDAEDAEYFINGSAADCLLLTPSLVDKQFYVSDLVKKPSTTIRTIMRKAFRTTSPDIEADTSKLAIWNALNEVGYYANRAKDNYKDDTRVADVTKQGRLYWNELVKANGRTVLDKKGYALAETIVGSFKTHEFTAKYFVEKSGVYHLAQYPIFFLYKGVKCKALLDLVIVDTINKTIQIIDVKTMGESTKLFPSNARRRRYDIQAAWYTLAIEQLGKLSLGISQIDLTPYRVKPFKFVVESTMNPGALPLVYTATPMDLGIGRHGTVIKTSSIQNQVSKRWKTIERTIHGYEYGVDLYKWHTNNHQWTYDRHIVEAKGDLPLLTWGR